MKQSTSIRPIANDAAVVVASIAALPGLTFPDALLQTLTARRLKWTRAAPENIEAPDDCLAFPLLWVDQQWDKGLEYIRRIENNVFRQRLVLVGIDPPTDIGPRLRKTGALTYARSELSEWLLVLIKRALLRLARWQERQWWDELRVARDATPAAALATLHCVAKLTRELLGPESLGILVHLPTTAELCLLEARQHEAVLVPWNQRLAEDPRAYIEAAERFDGHVVVPCIEHARRVREHTAGQSGGAFASVVHTSDEWRVTMLLRWKVPFLPTQKELAALDALGALAAAAWTQLVFTTKPEVLTPLGSFVRQATATRDRRGPASALVDACSRIMRASAALIMLRDSEELPERLHFACEWRDASDASRNQLFSGLQLPCPRDPATWPSAIEHAVEPLARPLRVMGVLMLPFDRTGVPKGALVFLTSGPSPATVPTLSARLRAQSAADLLAYGWPLVEALDETYAHNVADKLSERSAGSFDPAGLRELLTRAAKLVHDALAADQVFVQFGPDVAAYPAQEVGMRIEAGRDSLTSDARKRAQAIRILDTSDTERPQQARINQSGYSKLMRELDWKSARSLIIAPIDPDRGIIKVYTKDTGRFLTRADVAILKTVGERIRTVASPMVESAALHQLNELGSKLAGLSGDELARQLVIELEAWTARYIKADCQIFIAAQTEAGLPLMTAASQAINHLRAQFMEALSQANPRTTFGGLHALRELIVLPKWHGINGAVFVCHRLPLTVAAAPFVREAARETALLLHAEAVRQNLLQLGGFLRHGLLGPVQGIVSNALLIADSVDDKLDNAEIHAAARTIRQEAAAVRSWRTENRLVASLQNNKRISICARRSELRVFVHNCAERFRVLAVERNLTLHLALPRGGVLAEFDPEMLDIALSNMLDNAIKYAFFNREVTVGMRLRRHFVDVWVEDIGHGIPEQHKETIYESGTRGGQLDPFRVIRGEGLGLYLARQIAIAHDGEIGHTCEVAGKHTGDTTPYRVRFTLSIPGIR